MAKKQFEWRTYKGDAVPEEAVSPFDKKKEKVVQAMAKKALQLNAELIAFKDELYKKSDELYQERLKSRGQKVDKEWKGNYSHVSYDKDIKIEMNVQDSIAFSDDINIAKKLLNEYVAEKTSTTDNDIKQIVEGAFTTSKGSLDKSRILNLFSYAIEHPKWVQAMEMIKSSIETNDSKRYCKVSKRNKDNEYDAINLNFSSL